MLRGSIIKKLPINETETVDVDNKILSYQNNINFYSQVKYEYLEFQKELAQRRYTFLLCAKQLGVCKDVANIIAKRIYGEYNGLCYTQKDVEKYNKLTIKQYEKKLKQKEEENVDFFCCCKIMFLPHYLTLKSLVFGVKALWTCISALLLLFKIL